MSSRRPSQSSAEADAPHAPAPPLQSDHEQAALEAALQALLPTTLRAETRMLAAVLRGVIEQRVAPNQVPAYLQAQPEFAEMMAALAGQQVAQPDAIISFGAGSLLGDVSIGDVAGRDLVKLTILQENPYDVRRFALPNPYLGLHAFTYRDAARYAGREQLATETAQRLSQPGAEQACLIITGASGSGKSSFAQAGLIPALERCYAERGLAVQWAIMRPGASPLHAFADCIRQLGCAPDGVFAPLRPLMLTEPSQPEPTAPIRALLIDQFEEIFTLTKENPTERDALLALLGQLPTFALERMHIIATLRIEFLPALFPYPALFDQIKHGLELRAMDQTELKQAILQPMVQGHPTCGKQFEPALLARLAQDAAASSTYLPLLQFTLRELWSGGSLTLGCYHDLTSALKTWADTVYTYEDFAGARSRVREPAAQAELLAIFLDLVEISLNEQQQQSVRRRRFLDDLLVHAPERRALIDQCVQARLLSTGLSRREAAPPEPIAARSEPSAETVELIHESLMEHWDRLNTAIQERRDTLLRRARFEQHLREWKEHTRDPAYLLHGVHLSEAAELATDNDVALQSQAARAFYTQSQALVDRARKEELERAQRRALVLGAALLVAVIAALSAGYFAFTAQRQLRVNWAERSAALTETEPVNALALAVAASSQVDADAEAAVARALFQALNDVRLAQHWPQAARYGHADWLDAEQVLHGAAMTKDLITHNILDGTTPITRTLNLIPYSFAPSADRSLLLASNHEAVQLFSLPDWRMQALPPLRTQHIRGFVWAPTGHKVVVATFGDEYVWLWDLDQGREVRLEQLQGADLWRFDGSLDRTIVWVPSAEAILVLGATGNTVYAFDQTTGRKLTGLSAEVTAATALAWSAQQGVFSGHADGSVRRWALQRNGNRLEFHLHDTFRAHQLAVTTLAWSPGSSLLLTGSEDSTVALWDVHMQPPDERQRFYHPYGVQLARWAPDGQRILSVDQQGDLRIWDLHQSAQRGPSQAPPGPPVAITAANMHPTQGLALGTADGTVWLWRSDPLQLVGALQAVTAQDAVMSLAWNHDGSRLAVSFRDCRLGVWDTATQLPLWQHDLAYQVRTVTWLPHAGDVLTANGQPPPERCPLTDEAPEPALRRWAAETGQVLAVLPHPDPLLAAVRVLDADNHVLTMTRNNGQGQGRLQRLDLASGQQLWWIDVPYAGGDLPTLGSAPPLAISPDAAYALVGSDNANIYVIDLATGSEVAQLVGHRDAVTAVQWLPHLPGWAVSSSLDGTVRLWDLETTDGAVLVASYEAGTALKSLVVRSHGEEVISGDAQGRLQHWLVDYRQISTVLQQRLCTIHQNDDQRIAALAPNRSWIGCARIGQP